MGPLERATLNYWASRENVSEPSYLSR